TPHPAALRPPSPTRGEGKSMFRKRDVHDITNRLTGKRAGSMFTLKKKIRLSGNTMVETIVLPGASFAKSKRRRRGTEKGKTHI
ncbi:hypothetical protein, partial [Mesorhizobium sp.]|uniref:hypothetical protein n=1 Tax=Mesorhizobium sp. TaxID=1871066 RepID=UPI0025B907BC